MDVSGTGSGWPHPLHTSAQARERFGQFVVPSTVRTVEADHREGLGREEWTLGG